MGPLHLASTEEDSREDSLLPFEQQKKKVPKSNAKMMREYRKRVKADPVKYQKYLEQERQRNNRRKRRKRKELKDLNESIILNNTLQMMQTDTTDIQCKTEPLEESMETYDSVNITETAMKSHIGYSTELKIKSKLHVSIVPPVRSNPVQAAPPARQGMLGWNKAIQIRSSLPDELHQAFNIKLLDSDNVITAVTENQLDTAKPSSRKRFCVGEPAKTTTTSTISSAKVHTENQIPEKRRCIVKPSQPISSTSSGTKNYTINKLFSDPNEIQVNQSIIPDLISQDFKITLITLDQVPFRPKISVIRDRPATVAVKTGSSYERLIVSSANLTESNKTSNFASRTSDGNHETDSSQDGDVEDVTPPARLIDLTDDISDGESRTSISALADLPKQEDAVNGGTSTTSNTDVGQSAGEFGWNSTEEGNKNKINYLDSFMGFVTQQESETNKQRLVSKGMMWNRFS